jgi:A/G-specific adenine glycosylase
MKEFPSAKALAKAPLSKVLRMWQGLGYNRRAKMLHAAAKELAKRGAFPERVEDIEELTGVGPYTARAVAAFAYNQDVVFIETNIRTAAIHHFFPERKISMNVRPDTDNNQVTDAALLSLLEKALPSGKAREWYSALMDYGSFLKRSGVRLNARAKGYKKQKAFAGSDREARGAILKALVMGPKPATLLVDLFGSKRRGQMRSALAMLTKEGMIRLSRGKFRLPR